jgi:eukaryotic translation initiation factor 2C
VFIYARYKEGGFQAVALGVLRQNDARALDLHPDSQQFHLLKSFFKDVFVTFVHRPGKKKICRLVPNAGNFEFEGTTVKVGCGAIHSGH